MLEKIVHRRMNDYILKIICAVCVLQSSFHFINHNTIQAVSILSFGTLSLLLHHLNKKNGGSSYWMNFLISTFMVSFISVMAWFSGGINAPALIYFLPSVVYIMSLERKDIQILQISLVAIALVILYFGRNLGGVGGDYEGQVENLLRLNNYILSLGMSLLLLRFYKIQMNKHKQQLESLNESYDLVVSGSSLGHFEWKASDKIRIYCSDILLDIIESRTRVNWQFLDFLTDQTQVLDIEGQRKKIKSILSYQNEFSLELAVKGKTGKKSWVLCSGVVKRDHKGNILRVVGSVKDNTEFISTRKELRRINSIIDTTNSSLTSFIQGQVEGSVELLLNYVLRELCFEKGFLVYRSRNSETLNYFYISENDKIKFVVDARESQLTSFLKSCFDFERGEFVNQISRFDFMNYFVNPLFVNQGTQAMLVFANKATKFDYDESDLVKDLEQTFTLLIQGIIDRDLSKKLYKQLKEQKEVVESACEIKNQFLANMSHEMRTPMNSIVGLSEYLKEKNQDTSLIESIQDLSRSGHYLLCLIQDLLDYSMYNEYKIELKESSFLAEDFIHRVLRYVAGDIKDKGLEFIVHNEITSTHFTFDENRLYQILINVLSNAYKYTEFGHITFNIYERLGFLHFDIEDTGVGISEEELLRIFRPLESKNTHFKSSLKDVGIGLPLTKKIVGTMGGTLTIHSEVDRGTKVSIKVPRTDVRLSEVSGGADLKALDSLSILVAEDNELNIRLVKKNFEILNIKSTIYIAKNGQEAVDIYREQKIDIVLMDLQMPVMGGLEAIEIIRKSSACDEPYIIVVSANSFDEDKAMCFKAGANDFLAKPFSKDDLSLALARFIAPKTISA